MMRKIVLAGVLVLGLVGCASTATTSSVKSSVQVVDFDTAIRAYKKTKNSAYLESAETYALTDEQKAILERKLVDYLGANKVFDVQVSSSMGSTSSGGSSGYFHSDKSGYQNNNLTIHVVPKPNLPFELKYNTYKVFLGLKELTVYDRKTDFTKKSGKKFVENITIGIVNLKPSNKYTYIKRLKQKVLVYQKAVGFLNNGAEAILKKLDYEAIIDIYPSNVTVQANGIKWQNYYPFTDKHYVRHINTWHRSSDDKAEKYCKNLTIDNGGWRLPTKANLKSLASSKSVLDSLVGTKELTGKELYYSDTFDDYWGYKFRLIDFNKEKINSGSKYAAIRCVKSANTSLYDKTTRLEWENRIRLGGYPDEIQKICQSKKGGWRLPTAREYSYVIKNNTIQFTEDISSRLKWSTSQWKNTGNWVRNDFTLVTHTGEISKYGRKGNRFRCVRRK